MEKDFCSSDYEGNLICDVSIFMTLVNEYNICRPKKQDVLGISALFSMNFFTTTCIAAYW